MTFLQMAPPVALPVTLQQALDNLGIDGAESDERVTSWLRGIVSTLEKRIGRCLMRQTWQVTLGAFESSISLPHPVLRLVSIDYVDPTGEDRTLPLSAVRLVPQQYNTLLKPARGQTWPATLLDDEAVRITVECGYGDDPAATPADLKLYILAKLVEQYDPAAGGERETVQTSYLDSMLDPYRSYA